MKAKVIIIFGPTSSGKTALSLKLAQHLKSTYGLRSEIISADSRQVYKGMTIGTSKVSRADRKTVPHHGLDIEAPTRQYTPEQFARATTKLIPTIIERGGIPLVVGGSGTFVTALAGDTYLRGAENQKDCFEYLMLVPTYRRELLYRKIESTVDAMFRRGLYAELKQLIEQYHKVPKQAGKTIGYTEFIEYAKAHNKNVLNLNATDLEKIGHIVTKNHKRYAMRQMGWLGKMHGYHWVKNLTEAEELTDAFLQLSKTSRP